MDFEIISLGCPKNEADSEIIYRLLSNSHSNNSNSKVAIVNTCAFIRDAVSESISTIYALAKEKQKGNIHRLIVTGCLVNRYGQSLPRILPEVDAWISTGNILKISEIIKNGKGTYIENPLKSYKILFNANVLGKALYPERRYKYVRIADGCDNVCSFCIIPTLRGGYNSRSINSILSEIKQSIESGIKEIILVAQDLTDYGKDIGHSLEELLSEILKIKGDFWVRMLYFYPGKISNHLINMVAEKKEKLIPYFDIPIQHISDKILNLMRRKANSQDIRAQIKDIRNNISDAALRTTVMVGFPEETELDFRKLLNFIEEVKFDRLGTFVFSKEYENPYLQSLKEVKKGIARRRSHRVMRLQQRISYEKNLKFIGRELKVLVEGYDKGAQLFYGRSYRDAPEIDGIVWITDNSAKIGEFNLVKITEAWEYDLVGVIAS